MSARRQQQSEVHVGASGYQIAAWVESTYGIVLTDEQLAHLVQTFGTGIPTGLDATGNPVYEVGRDTGDSR